MYGTLINEVSNKNIDEDKNVGEDDKGGLVYDLNDIKGKIIRQTNAQTEIGNSIPKVIKIGIYQISLDIVRTQFIEKHAYIAQKMLNLI